MVSKMNSLLVFVLVNFVSANTVLPVAMEPFSDLYSHASTYPANNVVNYNASPNPQYPSRNFNNFVEQSTQLTPPPPMLQMARNYQNSNYQPIQQKQSLEETVNSPTSSSHDFSTDLKNTLVSVKNNLELVADTQRMLLNSFNTQQRDIEEKLQRNESHLQRAAYDSQPSYGIPQQPQYQLVSPPLPPLPYGHSTHQPQNVHHHKSISYKKLLKRLLRKNKHGKGRGLAVVRRRTEAERLERHAALTLTYIRNGIINALYTALVVACVKLVPILLFGFKLMFKSVLPLTGLALFGSNRGLFPAMKKDDTDDQHLDFDDIDEDRDEDDLDDLESDDDDDKTVSEEKDESSHLYH